MSSRWPTSRKNWRLLKPLARDLRNAPTPAEKALWAAIRKEQVAGFRFQRQRVFEKFIADFYCPRARLGIEVDGPIHDSQQDADANRETYLEDVGVRVLRFRNEEVLKHLPQVVARIRAALLKR